MKILVTGAYGQLGNEIRELVPEFPDWSFLFTDVDTLDITNENQVAKYFGEKKPTFVINCAAYTAVDKAESDIETATKVNSTAPLILAKYSKKYSSGFIHISTDYVFDGNANQPVSELNKVNPIGVYGKTKLEGEKNCLKHNPESVILRTSWLYSSFGNNFVKTMLRLAKEREELHVVFDQVGTPTYAADLAKTILEIIKKARADSNSFVPGIYHYSNEGVASWFDFARAVFELKGLNCEVYPVTSDAFPTPAKRPNYSVLDKKKIKETFKIGIPYWRESLKVCLQKL